MTMCHTVVGQDFGEKKHIGNCFLIILTLIDWLIC